MNLLPFNLERLDEKRVFVSNIGGFTHVVPSDQLTVLLEDPDLIPVPQRYELTRKLFVSEEQDYAAKRLALASAYAKRLTADLQFRPVFMFVPTLRCDHTCSYCQVARAPVDQLEFDMTEELLDQAVTRMVSIGSPPYSIEVQGGEPLLRFDLIEKLYQLCENKIGESNFSVVIASSLSLITSEVIEWARPRNISFSMSLDGTANVHDRNRILASDSSHARAVSGAKLILQELGSERLGFVTTITKEGLNDPQGLIDAYAELGGTNMFVRPLSPYGFARKKGMGSYTLEEYFVFYRELLRLLKIRWEAGLEVTEHSLGVHVKRLQKPDYNGYADLKSPSGYGLNAILFNYDGKLFGSDEARMLQRVHPEIDFSLGSVEDKELEISHLSEAIIEGGINLDKPGCSTCAYQPFCGADPLQNISLFGEPVGHKAQSPFCEYHKTMFSIAVEYLYGSATDRQFVQELAR